MFRDPFAQSLTGLNGRMEVFNRGARPVPEIEYAYALTLFYLEKVQTVPFRRMFNIKVEDRNGFADFLNELESATCLIRQLLPAALEETGGTMTVFDNHYARLEASPPRNAKNLPGRYMLRKPSEFKENPAP